VTELGGRCRRPSPGGLNLGAYGSAAKRNETLPLDFHNQPSLSRGMSTAQTVVSSKVSRTLSAALDLPDVKLANFVPLNTCLGVDRDLWHDSRKSPIADRSSAIHDGAWFGGAYDVR
jgi:hypothetical protein